MSEKKLVRPVLESLPLTIRTSDEREEEFRIFLVSNCNEMKALRKRRTNEFLATDPGLNEFSDLICASKPSVFNQTCRLTRFFAFPCIFGGLLPPVLLITGTISP